MTNDQIKLVQTAVRRAGIRTKFEGRYRLLLGQYLQPNGRPVTSCKQLTNNQLDDILAICEAHGWRMPDKSETYYRDKVNQAGDYATYAQQQAIRYLAEDLGMVGLHLNNFIRHMTNQTVDSIARLVSDDAWKIIEALKAILKRKTGVKFDSLQSIKEYFDQGATDGKGHNT